MAWLRKVQQSIPFTRVIARNFFTDVVPVDDHITGLNDTQQQVRQTHINIRTRTAMSITSYEQVSGSFVRRN